MLKLFHIYKQHLRDHIQGTSLHHLFLPHSYELFSHGSSNLPWNWMFSRTQDKCDSGQSGATVCASPTSPLRQTSFHTCHNFPRRNHDEFLLDVLPTVVCFERPFHSRCTCGVFRPNASSDNESFCEQITEDFSQCEFPIQPRNLSQWMRHTLEMLWEMTLTFLEKMSLSTDTHNLVSPFLGMCFTTKNYSFSWRYVQCWPKQTLWILFYEAKVPTLNGYSTI